MRGRFITLEGGEGAGKSTQLQSLAEALRMRDIDIVVTREPGGSEGAEAIRSLLVAGATDRWDSRTEALLHSAARRDHLIKTVWPALAAGRWVLSDRFSDSTIAYQGYGHGLDLSDLETLTQFTLGDFKPDLTLILDLPVTDGLNRAGHRGGGEDRYERMGVDFHQRLRMGFLEIAIKDGDRCAVIDATKPADQVHAAILDIVATRFFQ